MIFLQICEGIGKRIRTDVHSFAVNQKRLQAMIGITSVGDGIRTAFIDFQITVCDFSVFHTGCDTVNQWKGGFVQTEAGSSDDGRCHQKMSGFELTDSFRLDLEGIVAWQCEVITSDSFLPGDRINIQYIHIAFPLHIWNADNRITGDTEILEGTAAVGKMQI